MHPYLFLGEVPRLLMRKPFSKYLLVFYFDKGRNFVVRFKDRITVGNNHAITPSNRDNHTIPGQGQLSDRQCDHKGILDDPFLKGLVDGTLSREAFAFYMIQDAHYLR